MISSWLKTHKGARFCLAFALGCLASLSMAPANIWGVLFIALSGVYALLHSSRGVKQGFAVMWLFGFGYFLCSLSWIGSAVLVEDNSYRWAYPLAVAGIPFGLALFWGFTGALSRWIGRYDSAIGYLAFCGSFMLGELARGYLFTGFPWNLFGYTWTDAPALVQSVALFSVYGLTAITIFWAALPGFALMAARKRTVALTYVAAIAVFIALIGFGASQQGKTATHPVNFVLVPGDIAQADRWDQDKIIPNFLHYIDQSRADPANMPDKPSLIIWPETAMLDWYLHDPGLKREITAMLQSYTKGAVLITGMLRRDGEATYNSMAMIDANGHISNIYDKSHLVPFGEYIPFQNLISLPAVNRFSGFVPGQGPVLLETPYGVSYAPGICYEILFPYSLIPKSKVRPDYIINVTNDAWYAGSAGPAQHAIHAQYRAIEYSVPVIRVANMGGGVLFSHVKH